ncbi:MAG: hypothetical protein FD153_335 [Rhodospirillaceae bacterium]|nr:MAG: hypothetical protein FD153_335 [Rhodospirillaceae bacterium]
MKVLTRLANRLQAADAMIAESAGERQTPSLRKGNKGQSLIGFWHHLFSSRSSRQSMVVVMKQNMQPMMILVATVSGDF